VSSLGIAVFVFGCVFAGALLGMRLRAVLPTHHLSAESKDVVKLGTGLIATMAALVLGLMTSTAKASFDTQNNQLRLVAANVIFLDRILAHYGPETAEARAMVRESVTLMLAEISPKGFVATATAPTERTERLYERIIALAPATDAQRTLRAQALSLVVETSRMRWQLFEQREGAIPVPFLLVLTFWLAIIFASFGLQAPTNGTVVVTFLVCALSVAGAVLLVLELDRPFGGLIRVSPAPMLDVLTQIGR